MMDTRQILALGGCANELAVTSPNSVSIPAAAAIALCQVIWLMQSGHIVRRSTVQCIPGGMMSTTELALEPRLAAGANGFGVTLLPSAVCQDI